MESSEIVKTCQLYIEDIWIYLKKWDPIFATYIQTKKLTINVCQKLMKIKQLVDAMIIYKMMLESSYHSDVLKIHHRNEVSILLCHVLYKCAYPVHKSEIHPFEYDEWSEQKYWACKTQYDIMRQIVLSRDTYDVDTISYDFIKTKTINNGHDEYDLSWDYSVV